MATPAPEGPWRYWAWNDPEASSRRSKTLSLVKVEEHAYARRNDLLERVGRLDGFAPQPTLLAHDEHVKVWSWLEGVHEPKEPRPRRKLRPAHAVVNVYVRVSRGPTLLRRVPPSLIHLPTHGLLRLAHVVLVSRLARIDGHPHD